MGILIEHWLRDQRIGFEATAIRALENDDPTHQTIVSLARGIESRIDDLARLSLATTAQLTRVSDESWALLLGDDSSVVDAVRRYRRAPKSQILARRIFVAHAMTVISQPHLALRDFIKWATRTGIRKSGSTELYWSERLDALLANGGQEYFDLYRNATLIDARLRAIEGLYSAGLNRDTNGRVLDDDGLWLWLCQALLSQQFFWPLLSAEIGNATFGVSLPFEMALTQTHEGQKSRVYCRCRKRQYKPPERLEGDRSSLHQFVGGRIQWTNEFHRSLAIGLAAGKALWRSQNGRAAIEMRADYLNQSLVVDFTWAHRVIDDLSISEIVLLGRSAELYFSQVVLSRLLGSDAPLGVATGTIDTSASVLPVGYVDDIDAKVKYARDVGVFSRLVLPSALAASFTTNVRPALEELHAAGRLEVNFCPTARSAADAMQRGGWRRTTFLHAPEERFFFYDTLGRLFDAVKSSGNFREEDFDLDAEIEAARTAGPVISSDEIAALRRRVSGWLNGAQGVAKVRLSSDALRPQLVGSAIAWLDHTTRVDPLNTIGPGLGITFARFCRGDNEIRFWSQLFQIMNVSPALWSRFQWATIDQAQTILALILNNFNVDPRISTAPPPDLLVIHG